MNLATENDPLRHRLAFEELRTAISLRFINLPIEEIESGIVRSLGEVGRFLEVDRCNVLVAPVLGTVKSGQLPNDPTEWMFTQWHDEGVPSLLTEEGLVKIHPEPPEIEARAHAWFHDIIVNKRDLWIESLDDIPPEQGWLRRRMEAQHVKGRLGAPILYEGVCIGWIAVDAVHEQRTWTRETHEYLAAVGPIFGMAVLRRHDAEALEAAYRSLEAANSSLEEKVEERTRELREKQAQLVQSEKLASLGQLVAGVAHEVNTPLGVIKGNDQTFRRTFEKMVETLGEEDRARNPKLARLVENALRLTNSSGAPIDRIDTLVKSLRSFARLDRAELDTVRLEQSIEEVLVLLRSELGPGVEILRDFQSQSSVRCQVSQVNQALMNVLLNAAEAARPDGKIEIGTRDEGAGVRVEIRDDGVGVPGEDLPRVFDPGFTTKGVGVGAGLGLSIAHRVIVGHGGTIDIQSAPGSWTSVSIWLPRVMTAAPSQARGVRDVRDQ